MGSSHCSSARAGLRLGPKMRRRNRLISTCCGAIRRISLRSRSLAHWLMPAVIVPLRAPLISKQCAGIRGTPRRELILGNLFYTDGELAAARAQYQAALAVDAELPEAHQGLARIMTRLGEADAATPHWLKGFARHAIAVQPYRGVSPPIPVLLLVSVKDGNIVTKQVLDDRIFAVTALYAEFYDPAQALPPHTFVFNAIGDADLCPTALARAPKRLSRERQRR